MVAGTWSVLFSEMLWPTCTPSPEKAEQAWFCHSRSRYVCRLRPSAISAGRRGRGQVLLVGKDEHWNPLQVFINDQLWQLLRGQQCYFREEHSVWTTSLCCLQLLVCLSTVMIQGLLLTLQFYTTTFGIVSSNRFLSALSMTYIWRKEEIGGSFIIF